MDISLLETEIENGNALGVKEILLKNSELAKAITSHKISPLLLACYYKKQDIVNIIVEYAGQLDIFEACASGKFDQATHLIFKDPRIIHEFSDDGFTPLGLACFFGHEEIARFLLLKGADPNVPSQNGFNVFPIHSAVAGNYFNLCKILLENGAYPNVCQKAGLSPLHSAAQLGNIEILIILLEHGAEVNLRMEGGKLPSDLAEEKGFLEIAEILKED